MSICTVQIHTCQSDMSPERCTPKNGKMCVRKKNRKMKERHEYLSTQKKSINIYPSQTKKYEYECRVKKTSYIMGRREYIAQYAQNATTSHLF